MERDWNLRPPPHFSEQVVQVPDQELTAQSMGQAKVLQETVWLVDGQLLPWTALVKMERVFVLEPAPQDLVHLEYADQPEMMQPGVG